MTMGSVRVGCAVLCAALGLCFAAPARGQWLNHPDKGAPRTADGKVNLKAPAPKRPDGKPELSGVWMGTTKYMINIAADLKPEEVPFQPWAATEYARRRETESKDDPSAQCLPLVPTLRNTITSPFKLVNAAGYDLIIMMYEGQRPRQIFMDGRALPAKPLASWDGYSVGHWEGDVMVVETNGLNGKAWLDINGHMITEDGRLIERYRRLDFGRMSYEVTINDPKAYTKPWTAKLELRLLPDTELLEAVCENNLDLQHMVGK